MKCLAAAGTILMLASMSLPAQAADPAAADGWYQWRIIDGESAGMMVYVHKRQDRTVRISVSGHNCGIPRRAAAIDLGEITTDDAVSMLLAIVMNDEMSRDVREQALFGLAQSGSDRAFATLDALIFGG
ncbi:MAG: HEAT repeat domain-containing protein [Woeseiaceae bacterium]|nr:HEAT repeat domain-containing protein [Woeseiaceae bacterium]